MSDGAKTGTIWTDKERDIDSALSQMTDEWIEAGECCPRTVSDLRDEFIDCRAALTEALKVAGEALAFIECEARTDDASGYHVRAKLTFEWVEQRRAALERIRKP